MWFKNATIFQVKAPVNYADLEKHQFAPLTGLEVTRSGLAPVCGEFAFQSGNFTFMAVRTDKKLLPASVVAEATRIKAAEIEEREGYRPGRKQLREIKADVTNELLPKAFTVSTVTHVFFDAARSLLVIDTSSHSRADAIIGVLLRAIEGLTVGMLRPDKASAQTLTHWIEHDDLPRGFNVDQDAEFVARGERPAKIRYSRHSLDGTDVANLIASGKVCTQLALTWKDSISFVLTETFGLKRIAPLDLIAESAQDDAPDFVVMAGQIGRLLDDLGAVGRSHEQ